MSAGVKSLIDLPLTIQVIGDIGIDAPVKYATLSFVIGDVGTLSLYLH